MNRSLRPFRSPLLLTLAILVGASSVAVSGAAGTRAAPQPAADAPSDAPADAAAARGDATDRDEAPARAPAPPAAGQEPSDQQTAAAGDGAEGQGPAEPAGSGRAETATEIPASGEASHESTGDPEMDQLKRVDQEFEAKTAELLEKHNAAAMPAEREAVRQELVSAVNQHFDVRQQIRARELAALEKAIAELRQSLNRRTELREKIVQRRIRELLGDETEDLAF